jgi:preprotein translocase subunit SecG
VFGGSGAGNFLTRLTVISAALFMLLSATLTYVSSSGEQSLERAAAKVRMREEARNATTKKSAAIKAAPPAGQSTAESTPEGAPGATGTAPAATPIVVQQVDGIGGKPIEAAGANPPVPVPVPAQPPAP